MPNVPAATWLIVGGCALGSVLSLLVAGRAAGAERLCWLVVGTVAALFGVHKLFAIQAMVVAEGEWLAERGGWYLERRGVQRELMLGVTLAAGGALVAFGLAARRVSAATVVAMVAATLLILYALMGMISLHEWDRLVSRQLLGVEVYTLIELLLPGWITACAARALADKSLVHVA